MSFGDKIKNLAAKRVGLVFLLKMSYYFLSSIDSFAEYIFKNFFYEIIISIFVFLYSFSKF